MTRTSCNPKLSSSSLIYQVREQLVDSRKDVDWQLKKTCEEFIHLAVSSLVSPIRHFLEKATYLVGEQKTDDKKSAASFASEVSTSTATSVKPLRLQPFATPEKVWITSRMIKDLTLNYQNYSFHKTLQTWQTLELVESTQSLALIAFWYAPRSVKQWSV